MKGKNGKIILAFAISNILPPAILWCQVGKRENSVRRELVIELYDCLWCFTQLPTFAMVTLLKLWGFLFCRTTLSNATINASWICNRISRLWCTYSLDKIRSGIHGRNSCSLIRFVCRKITVVTWSNSDRLQRYPTSGDKFSTQTITVFEHRTWLLVHRET